MSRVLEKPQIVFRGGKPKAVILDIKRYQKLLDLAEEREDAAELRRLKQQKTSFRPLEEYARQRI